MQMFKNKRLYRTHEGQGVYAEYYWGISEKQCVEYCRRLEKSGFELYEEHSFGANTFYTYVKGTDIYFVSYYPNVQEMHIVSEPNSNWLQYSDRPGEDKVATLLRQVDLEDFGESYVIRMEIEGQVILWSGDSYFEYTKMDERYGTYLKSDIFQIPHHGFPGGDIKTYDFIRPDVCLICGLDWVWLGTKFKFYELECNQHLIYNMDVKEYLMGGDGDITLALPYTPEKDRKEELLKKIAKLRRY